MSKIKTDRREIMDKILRDSDIERLVAVIDRLDRQTRNEVIEAISTQLNLTKKNYHINQIKTYIKASETEIKNWIVTAVADSYATGANLAYADLKATGVKVPSGEVYTEEFTAQKIKEINALTIHKEAVNALVSDTYLDFANGMNGLLKGAEHQINEAMKRQMRAHMIAGHLTGASMDTIAKEVKTILGDQGFSVLLDRGGHQWSLQQYSSMLVRTHIMKSTNEGTLNRITEWNCDIVQISTHAGACKLCQPYEGKIYSVSGKSKKYPKMTVFFPLHPNCRHTYLPRPYLS